MAVRKKPVPPRAWQRMLSGRRLDLLDPSPLDVEIADVAPPLDGDADRLEIVPSHHGDVGLLQILQFVRLFDDLLDLRRTIEPMAVRWAPGMEWAR